MMSLHVAKTNDISIHAAREGGDLERKIVLDAARISIHAAREGGDGFATVPTASGSDFNPRRP